ncbi:MAG TPA: DUF6502 family protein [Burkholderiales bacterium]|nr:DUF6502 family protein [Burkholderiales bacterium]
MRSPVEDKQGALWSALHTLLRPLVRLLIAHGITYPALSDLLKTLYIEVAENDFRIEGRPQTDSRLSLLTGVHRKDVRRLASGSERHVAKPPTSVSLGAQLVGVWTSQPPYLDASGRPRPLPRLARDGGAISFEALVEGVSKDIRSRAVLDEWLRLGVVHLDHEDRVCLNSDAFVPREGLDEKLYYLGHNVHDHMSAAVHNVLGSEPPFLERSVHYDALSLDSIERLKDLAQDEGMRALKAINREANRLERKDSASAAGDQRFTFGIYFFATESNKAKADEEKE